MNDSKRIADRLERIIPGSTRQPTVSRSLVDFAVGASADRTHFETMSSKLVNDDLSIARRMTLFAVPTAPDADDSPLAA